jgi:hypothetical protein
VSLTRNEAAQSLGNAAQFSGSQSSSLHERQMMLSSLLICQLFRPNAAPVAAGISIANLSAAGALPGRRAWNVDL